MSLYAMSLYVMFLYAMPRECVENEQRTMPVDLVQQRAARSAHMSVTGVRTVRIGLSLVTCTLLGGCGLSGAPSFSLFGAFFPAWLLCAVFGILCAILARVVFIGTGLADVLPFQLLVCTSIGLIFGAVTWLWAFGY